MEIRLSGSFPRTRFLNDLLVSVTLLVRDAAPDEEFAHGNALLKRSEDADAEEDDSLLFTAGFKMIDLDLDDTTEDLPENFDCALKTELRDDFLELE